MSNQQFVPVTSTLDIFISMSVLKRGMDGSFLLFLVFLLMEEI